MEETRAPASSVAARASGAECKLMVSLPSEMRIRTGRVPARRWLEMKLAAEISASNNGVAEPLFIAESLLSECAVPQSKEQRHAGSVSPLDSCNTRPGAAPNDPPNDRTEMFSSGTARS